MSNKIDQLEAEAEAGAEIQEEYSGDVLASQFARLEKTSGADDELLALKRKMGLAPPEEAPPAKEAEPVQSRVEAPAQTQAPARVESTSPEGTTREQEELAAALEELEAEQQGAQQRKAGR